MQGEEARSAPAWESWERARKAARIVGSAVYAREPHHAGVGSQRQNDRPTAAEHCMITNGGKYSGTTNGGGGGGGSNVRSSSKLFNGINTERKGVGSEGQ